MTSAVAEVMTCNVDDVMCNGGDVMCNGVDVMSRGCAGGGERVHQLDNRVDVTHAQTRVETLHVSTWHSGCVLTSKVEILSLFEPKLHFLIKK